MSYLEGVKTGYATGGGNPFSVIVGRVKEAQARKLAEEKKDKDELRELEQLFQTLAKKHEYDTESERQKAEIGLQLEKEKGIQERITKLAEGYTFDDSGNAIEPEEQTIQAQPIDRTQQLLQMTGLAMPSKMVPVAKTQPKKQDNSMLAEQFGFGKGVKLKKKDTLDVALSPEEALKRIPKGANPDDYEPKAIVRNIKGIPTEIYVANRKPEVIQAEKKQETLRIEAETQEKEVNAMIDAVWSKADELIPAQETGRGGVIKGMERSYRASSFGRFISGGKEDKEQTGEKARAYKDYQLGTLSLLIRSLGEKGVLTDQDIGRSKEFEPKFGDSITLRKTKREAMREFLKSKLQAHNKTQGLQAQVEEQSNQSGDSEYDKMKQLIGQ